MGKEICNEFVKEAIALGKRIDEGNLATVVMDNGFVLPVGPLLKAYKKLSSVDLEELGLVDIVVQFAD